MGRINCAFAVGLTGLFFFLMGLGFLWFGTKSLIKMWAWENLTLKNGSEAMQRWKRPSQPISMKVYLFNLTNPESVSEGAPPNFSEVGPYVYEQHREKVNIIELENFTLSYQLRNIIQFKPNLSGRLKESDKVTVVNVPLIGAILATYEAVPEFVSYWDELWKFFHPGQRNAFITTTVRNILFDGIVIDCTSKITEIYIACRGLDNRKGTAIRKEGKNFKFSFFYSKNGTSKETYQVNQGLSDIKKSAQFVSIDHSLSAKTWKNHKCDMINGSDGAQFPVMLNKNEKLYIFEKELCRSVYIEFETVVNRKGVELYKYSTSYSLFASPNTNPDNKCFCRSEMTLVDVVKDEEEEEEEEEEEMDVEYHNPNVCLEDGVLPLMACYGSPIVASFPHFYLGDQIYSNYSDFKPVKDLHETVAYVEPFSGVTVMGFKRLQFNLEVKRIPDIQITSNLVDCLFPILWVEEGMELSTDLFKLLRLRLIQKKVLEYGTLVLVGVGLLLIIIAYGAQYVTDRSRLCEPYGFKKSVDLQISESGWNGKKLRNYRGLWRNPKVSPSNLFSEKIHKSLAMQNQGSGLEFATGISKNPPFSLPM